MNYKLSEIVLNSDSLSCPYAATLHGGGGKMLKRASSCYRDYFKM